jgi:hypothetical protein
VKSTNAGHSIVILLITIATTALAAAEPHWTGEYADRNFLNGQAAFQLSIEQSGNAIQVSFDAAYKDAHGAAPDGEGPAKIAANGTLEFNGKTVLRILEPAGSGAWARTSSCQ